MPQVGEISPHPRDRRRRGLAPPASPVLDVLRPVSHASERRPVARYDALRHGGVAACGSHRHLGPRAVQAWDEDDGRRPVHRRTARPPRPNGGGGVVDVALPIVQERVLPVSPWPLGPRRVPVRTAKHRAVNPPPPVAVEPPYGERDDPEQDRKDCERDDRRKGDRYGGFPDRAEQVGGGRAAACLGHAGSRRGGRFGWGVGGRGGVGSGGSGDEGIVRREEGRSEA